MKVIEIEWNTIISRLHHHRKRLNLTKDDVKKIIKEKYNKTFFQLTDSEIMELGKSLKEM